MPSMVVTLVPSAWGGEHCAGLYGLAVNMDDAGAALRRVATHMGARQGEIRAQILDQQRAVFDLSADLSTIHSH